MSALFFKVKGAASETTGVEYCLWAGVFMSAFVASAMIVITKLAHAQVANQVVAYLF